MPTTFAPIKSGAHRLACLSLYRSLLRRCGDLSFKTASSSNPDKTSSSVTLCALVQYRFRKDKKFQNWQQIRNALKFGRDALQVIEDASAGSYKALDQMSRIISASASVVTRNMQVLQQVKKEQNERQLPKKFRERKAREAYLADKSNYERNPDITPVLERPVPYENALKHEDGRRKVPSYFIAQGIPFLRYTRHQPLSLGRYMMNQVQEYDKFWTKAAEGDQSVALASLEDDWDLQLRKDHGHSHVDVQLGTNELDSTFVDPVRSARQDLEAKKKRLDENRLRHGTKLWNIFLKEEALAKVENAKRKEENRKKRYADQAERESKTPKETKMVAKQFRRGEYERGNNHADEILSHYKPMAAGTKVGKQ